MKMYSRSRSHRLLASLCTLHSALRMGWLLALPLATLAQSPLPDSFDPGVGSAGAVVYSLAVQPDGKILVGGSFVGQSRTNIGRLNADGTLDTTFNPVANSPVACMAMQADGKILVGGAFTTLGGQSRNFMGRLNADGTLDTSFDPWESGGYVFALALQADGKTLVGGGFNSLGGQIRNNIGRLNSTGPAMQSLTFDGSTLIWTRGGASPEVWLTSFEHSSNGTSWANLGEGVRIPGGWQLTGLALPTNALLRARGYAVGGYQNSSDWFVETIIGPPAITAQPTGLTNNAGTPAAFTVYALGSGPLSYQWRKDGEGLADGANVSGAATASLTLSNVLGGDAGRYSLVITNSAGSVTSAVATLTVIDPVINVQPASQTKSAGESVTFSVTAVGTSPLGYQWRKEGVAQVGATQSALTLTNFQGGDAGAYDVSVSNAWGSATSTVALLSMNLALPDDSFTPGVYGGIPQSLAVQTDGKILVGGNFGNLNGQTHVAIGRLSADGSLDTRFNPEASPIQADVDSLAVQADGKILAGGQFASMGGNGGQLNDSIARLYADGTLDTNVAMVGGYYPSVYSLGLQADGKILIGGFALNLSDGHFGRLNSGGTVDTNFNPGANQFVYSLALQPDGKILVGGRFTTLGGQSRSKIGRLSADGTLDTSFNPGASGSGFGDVYSLAVQADGKILVGGQFSTLGGQSRSHIGRLNKDGTLDTNFNPGADSVVVSMALQTDGKILVGGYFTNLGGQSRSHIGRLNTDGTLDTNFNPGANNTVLSLALQADGKLLVGGNFTMLGGQSRNAIGRLMNPEPATQSLAFDGSTLTWLRGGTSPEVWRTAFEYSPDGTAWKDLGAGLRIPGGWQLTGLAMPTNTTFRARGYTTGGQYNGSSWFVESVLRPPLAISGPLLSANGQFGLSASGPAGQLVVIEVSPDLVTWTPLQTNILGAAQLPFTDPQPALLPSRFYRLRSGP